MDQVKRAASLEGRYRLRSIIGEGGMGTVWSGERIADHADVAIKILKVKDVEQMRRLVREARIAERLLHDNVVRVDEVLASSTSFAPALVMERLRGESLRERLSRAGRLSLGETARVLLDMTSALEAAHALGIVHRDLKPENVFLHHEASRTVVKVLDFGIAKIVKAAASDLHTAGMTRTGAMLGTPYYMPPEQVFGEGDVDARADVWACGVVLFECLAGRRPFEGDNHGQVFKAIAMAAPPSLRAHVQDLPEAVFALIDRMLAHDRDARPSLEEVRACLLPWADDHVSRAVIRAATEGAAADAADAAEPLAPTVEAAAFLERDEKIDAVLTPASFEVPSRFSVRRRFGVLAAVVAGGVGLLAVLVIVSRGTGTANENARSLGEVAWVSPAIAIATSDSAMTATPATTPAIDPPTPPPPAVIRNKPPRTTTTTSPPTASSVAAASPAVTTPPSAAPPRLPGGVQAASPY